jgi:hypothetical protein
MTPLLIDYTPTTFVIVGVKEDALNTARTASGNVAYLTPSGFITIDLPPGEYGEPFLMSEATEDKLKELIEEKTFERNNPLIEVYDDDDFVRFKNYGTRSKVDDAVFSFESRLFSVISILDKERLYLKNPMGEKEPEITDPNPSSQYYAAQQYNKALWHSYQERTYVDIIIVPKLK